MCAHIMGVVVSETTSETTIATESVTANSRNRRPTMPPIISSGMNTATSETLMREHGEADLLGASRVTPSKASCPARDSA